MKRASVFLLLIVTGLLSVVLSVIQSCTKEKRKNAFLIQVDSIKATIDVNSANPGASTVETDLFGTISTNGCSAFSHFNTYIKGNDLIIEAWKTTDSGENICPDVMVYLNRHVSFDRKLLPEEFRIKVKQPDGSFLSKTMP